MRRRVWPWAPVASLKAKLLPTNPAMTWRRFIRPTTQAGSLLQFCDVSYQGGRPGAAGGEVDASSVVLSTKSATRSKSATLVRVADFVADLSWRKSDEASTARLQALRPCFPGADLPRPSIVLL